MSRQAKKTESKPTLVRRLLSKGSKPDTAMWMYCGIQTDIEVGKSACLVRGPTNVREIKHVSLEYINHFSDDIQIPWELRESWERITR